MVVLKYMTSSLSESKGHTQGVCMCVYVHIRCIMRVHVGAHIMHVEERSSLSSLGVR